MLARKTLRLEINATPGAPGSFKRRRLLVIAAVAGALMSLASSAAGAMSAQEVNHNFFSAATLQLEGSGSTTCFSTGEGSGGSVETNDAQCSGSALPTGQLSTSSTLSATTVLSSLGRSNPQQGGLGLLSCGAAQVADISGSGNTGLLYGAISYASPFSSPVSPGFTSSGLSLSGAAGTYVGTVESITSPLSFGVVGWVKTTTTTGGGIIGFSNVQPDTHPSSEDRMLWVDPSGAIVFGVQTRLTMTELTSAVDVNDGTWHFVAASLSSSTMTLDVDGATVSTTTTFPNTYTGYWHLGWAGTSGWTNAGTDEYFNGSLYGVALFAGSLSSGDVNELNDASSASTYLALVSGFSPSAFWPLSDAGTTAYTGTIPVLGNNQLCQRVLVDVEATRGSNVSCVYPSTPGACPASLSSSATLSALSASMPTPMAGSSLSLLISMELGISSVPGVTGLHVVTDLDFQTTAGSWSAQIAYLSNALEM